MDEDTSTTLAQRCRRIRLLVLDVDGVLTPGGIVHGTGGLELKWFHVRDGSGLKVWHRAGMSSAILTGRSSPVVAHRAGELDIPLVMQGVGDKGEAFAELLRRANVTAEEACFVGDDLPDLPPLRRAGLAAAVADACPEVRGVAHHVTRRAGGRGAVREVVELVLRCQGAWPAAREEA